jgi:hypothetical protein
MICTHDLIVLTKTKDTIHYYRSFRYSDKNALNTVTNDLMHVSVPVEKN